MNPQCVFYICPTCFMASERATPCHGRPMLKYDFCQQSAEQRKPLTDGNGRLKSNAPCWFLDQKQTQPLIEVTA